MLRNMFKSKIHRATVTHADLDYEGSVTIDKDLLDAADIRHWEQVEIYNITNGSRLTTYALHGTPGSGEIQINGAAAHLTGVGDLVIVCSYARYTEAEAATHEPRILLVGKENRVVSLVGSGT